MTGYITLAVSGRDMSAFGTLLPFTDVRAISDIAGKQEVICSLCRGTN
jgi:hypothetical protein